MCGIVGVLGTHEAAPIILEALGRLEYRGYDSAGIATLDGGRLDRRRAVGKLVNLSDALVHEPLRGKAGIGHTRWATHGAPTLENAHPHRAGRVAVVHNGIIENFRTLRAELAEAGHAATTGTDTETIALLAHHYLEQGYAPRDAAAATLARLEGAFALCLLFEGEEDLMIAARKGSPLAIGHGEGAMFVGSDAIALAPLTNRLTYLEEGDWAVITRAGVEIFDSAGRRANRPVTKISVEAARVDKAGHRHFMAKEIMEQPAILGDLVNHYLAADDSHVALPGELDFADCDRLTLVGCGTAFYACSVAKYWFEKVAGLPVDVDIASEFRYRDPVLSPESWAVFVSQSGETADTLAALRYCEGRVARTLSVVNVPTSSIARESGIAIGIHAGAEIGVASTKAFTCQLAVLLMMALKAGADRGRLSAADYAAHLADLRNLPGFVNQALGHDGDFRAAAQALSGARDVLFLGRGTMFPLALEGALKLKEISYIHAAGYPAGELKHGPIALIDQSVPVVVMAPHDGLFDKTVSNMQEVMAREGRVILVSDAEGIAAGGDGCWRTLTMPDVPEILAPIVYAVPAQLLAYHTAVAKGTDVDQPRNLAKSVTVE